MSEITQAVKLAKDYDQLQQIHPGRAVITKKEFILTFLHKELESLNNSLESWCASSKKKYKKTYESHLKRQKSLEDQIYLIDC